MQLIGWPLLWIGTLFGAVIFGYIQGREHVQAEWDTEKTATVIAQRDKEAALQASMDKLRTEKNRELARLNNTVQRLSSSLRDRPDRPFSGADASARPDSEGCTGAVVYRQDGEFLIGEATRADQLRIALIECRSAYQAAAGKQPE